MRKLTLRLLACLALAGQLQWLPGAALCERHHAQAFSHCVQHSPPAGRAVEPAQAPKTDACPLAGACSAPAPALPADGSVVISTVAVTTGDAGVFTAPPSFNPVPLSPPPQS